MLFLVSCAVKILIFYRGSVFPEESFFFSMKSEKLSDFKDTVNVLWIILMFFVMIKNKLILLHCECTSLLEKKKILSSCKLCCLGVLTKHGM